MPSDESERQYREEQGRHLRGLMAEEAGGSYAQAAGDEPLPLVDAEGINGHLQRAGDEIDAAIDLLREMIERAVADRRYDDVSNLQVQVAEITRAGRVIAEHVTA